MSSLVEKQLHLRDFTVTLREKRFDRGSFRGGCLLHLSHAVFKQHVLLSLITCVRTAITENLYFYWEKSVPSHLTGAV